MRVYRYYQLRERVEEEFFAPELAGRIKELKLALVPLWEKNDAAWDFVGEEEFGDGVWVFIVYEPSMMLGQASKSTAFVLDLKSPTTVWVVKQSHEDLFMEKGYLTETIEIFHYEK